MKNQKEHSENFRFDLITLILLIILLGTSIVKAQDDLQKGIEIFEKKNYYGAKRFFNDYLQVHPEEATAYYYLGRIAMEEQDLEAATDHFDKAVDIDDTRSEYFTWKGIAYVQLLSTVDFMQQGIYAPRALNALETAVNLDPNNIDARMWLASYYTNAPVFAGGSQEKTKEQYEAVLEIDPAFVPGYINYGVALMGFEEYDLAFEYFEKALEYDPENYSVYLFIGQLSAESGKYTTQGELSLKKFIDLAPEAFEDSKDEAWWYLGTIYLQEGNTEDARSAYEKAIALDPENEDYQKSLKKLI
jgi:tetratricopeptide (TPR) repeat protein